MSLSRLPLGYCTNVHPGRSVAEVEAGLDRYAVPVARGFGRSMAAGLWLTEPVVRELLSSQDRLVRFADGLQSRGLSCHTLNAFPFGDFHSERVKENVYLPDWTDPRRLEYTAQCANVLAALLPEGADGSISTVPLGFKNLVRGSDFLQRSGLQLIECARRLSALRQRNGKIIRLAIEPEPLCVLETTPEAIEFFQQLWRQAEMQHATQIVHEHIGLCYDVCHQAVEFEDAAASIAAIDRAGIRINKVHLSCALQLEEPGTNNLGRAALKRYAEPRYLHQMIARSSSGKIVRMVDLTESFADHPDDEFAAAPVWRIHFHVPVDSERLGPLQTTRSALIDALPAVAALNYAPHLEVETYTWEVLPVSGAIDLVGGLTRELRATSQLLQNVERNGKD